MQKEIYLQYKRAYKCKGIAFLYQKILFKQEIKVNKNYSLNMLCCY